MDRIVGVLRLDATVFDEVARDPTANQQAVFVVLAHTVAEAIARMHASSIPDFLVGIAFLSMVAVPLWTATTGLTWLVGVKLLGGRGDFAQLLRAGAFASAPKLLLVFAVIPLGIATGPFLLLLMGLTVATNVLALRRVLQVSMGKILVVILVKLAFAAAFSAMVPSAALGLRDSLPGAPDPTFRFPSRSPRAAASAATRTAAGFPIPR